MSKKILHLNVKAIYFDQVVSGKKTEEYRQRNAFWFKRLAKNYTHIHYKRGYPKTGDTDKILEFPYRGYKKETITHEHFGGEPTEVYTIELRKQ